VKLTLICRTEITLHTWGGAGHWDGFLPLLTLTRWHAHWLVGRVECRCRSRVVVSNAANLACHWRLHWHRHTPCQPMHTAQLTLHHIWRSFDTFWQLTYHVQWCHWTQSGNRCYVMMNLFTGRISNGNKQPKHWRVISSNKHNKVKLTLDNIKSINM